MPNAAPSRLQRLQSYLEADPANLSLLADAANAALDESALDTALDLVARYRALAEVPAALANVEGMAAMRSGDYARARHAFAGLRAGGHDHPVVRFNLAWLSALEGRFEDVLALADDEVIAAVPRAAALKVQALHHTGDIDGALALGQQLLERLPEDDALLGAASVAAMDADDYALAAQLAGRATGGADALTTTGLVALNEEDPARALALFDRALAEAPQAPRAWIGKGLGLLASGDAAAAAPCLEKGAAIFGDHLGSWIAAGWAHFTNRDLAAARRAFETALAFDDNFAETHGGLAVLDIAAGDLEGARRRSEIALRLDHECFGGMLAKVLLLEADGKPELAQRIVERAMAMPAGVDGKTLAQALTGIGLQRGPAAGQGRLH
ncbi:MAG: hypothetical protein KGN34_10060 [Sphingomonadales bacterium]|nr:hypothetical protein [Sphingomonadales bacterium]